MGFFQALGETKENPVQAIQDVDTHNQSMANQQQDNRLKAIDEQKQQIVLNEAKRKEEQLDQDVYIDHVLDFHKQNPTKQWDLVQQTFGDKFQKDPTTGRTRIKVRDIQNMVSVMQTSDALQNKMLDAGAIDLAQKALGVEKQITDIMIKKSEGGEINEKKLAELQALKQRYDEENSKLTKFRIQARGTDAGLQSLQADEAKYAAMENKLNIEKYKLESKEAALEVKAKQNEFNNALKLQNFNMHAANLQARFAELAMSERRLFEQQKGADVKTTLDTGKFLMDELTMQVKAWSAAKAPAAKAFSTLGPGSSAQDLMSALAKPENQKVLTEYQKEYVTAKANSISKMVSDNVKKISGIETMKPIAYGDLKSIKNIIDRPSVKKLSKPEVIEVISLEGNVSREDAAKMLSNTLAAIDAGRLK